MTQVISIQPSENGTAIVVITPFDEEGTALTFSELGTPQWQLMKTDGTVINSRTFAASAMTNLKAVLSGADLAVASSGDDGGRVFSFQATYNSTEGNNLPLTAECSFVVDNLVGQ